MPIDLKPFQSATIDAALCAFRSRTGPRRFLVADEVGLGKTIIASGIVERLAARRPEPLRVFYVCSNLAIATQNLARLASFLPDNERKSAIARADRPSLMPTRDLPTHDSVHVFSLTPDTALPSRRRRRREGRVEERALGLALLKELLPRTIPRLCRSPSCERGAAAVRPLASTLADSDQERGNRRSDIPTNISSCVTCRAGRRTRATSATANTSPRQLG